MLRFRDFGVFVFDLGCFVFEFWVLRFRVLGASFSRFRGLRFRSRVLRFRDLGVSCFGLRFRNYRQLCGLSGYVDFVLITNENVYEP